MAEIKLSGSTENLSICQLTDIGVNAKLNNPLEKLQAFMESLDANSRLLFCAESAGRREILLELLGDADIKLMSLTAGKTFWAPNKNWYHHLSN